MGWGLVGGLLPVWGFAHHELGWAAWPAVLVAGSLVSGVQLGVPQAWALPSTTRTRASWVLGTIGGIIAAIAVIRVASLVGCPRSAAGAAAGVTLAAVQAVAVGSRPGRWPATSRWIACAALGSVILQSEWAGPWSAWGEGSWQSWAESVTLPLRPWLGKTAQRIAAGVSVGVVTGGIGGIGYGAITALARPHALCDGTKMVRRLE